MKVSRSQAVGIVVLALLLLLLAWLRHVGVLS